MIRKYRKFFEELKITKELSAQEAFLDFIDDLKECVHYHKYEYEGQFAKSYSHSAQDRRENGDPEEDFKLVNNYMSKKGWTLETMRELADEYGKDSFNLRIEDINPSRCAPIDYYLYVITEKTFPLQGYSWDIFSDDGDMTGDPMQNEYLIRFGYGWHNTKYGKLCIEQNLGSVDNFLKKVKQQIPSYLISLFTYKRDWKIISFEFDVDKWIDEFLDMDGSLYAHLDDLYDLSSPYFIKPLEYEDFCNRFIDGVKEFEKELGQKVNATRLRDEIRISI
jgi:hypothetical protein